MPLRLGPQIQTLLSREGRRAGGRLTGRSRDGSGCSTRGASAGSHAGAEAPDPAAMEDDDVPGLRPAHPNAAEGRWELSDGWRPCPRTHETQATDP
jgi:hypothetical protein